MPRKRARIAKEGPSQAVENEIQGATRDQGSATKAAEESEYHGGSGRGAGRSAPGAQSSAGGETDDDEQEERKTSQALAEAVWLVGQELDAYDDVWNGPLTWSFPHLLPRVRDVRLSTSLSLSLSRPLGHRRCRQPTKRCVRHAHRVVPARRRPLPSFPSAAVLVFSIHSVPFTSCR